MYKVAEKATRSALRRLGDVAYLSQCPLADLIVERAGWRLDGHTLQQTLCQAIEALQPAEGWPYPTTQQLRYDILRMRYFEGRDIADITHELALSERQYYRELRAAILMVAERVLGGSW